MVKKKEPEYSVLPIEEAIKALFPGYKHYCKCSVLQIQCVHYPESIAAPIDINSDFTRPIDIHYEHIHLKRYWTPENPYKDLYAAGCTTCSTLYYYFKNHISDYVVQI